MADAVVTENGKERFERVLSIARTWSVLNIDADDGTEHLIALLDRGQVRMELVALIDGDTWATCYDVYVRTGERSEWIFYESIYQVCGSLFEENLYDEMKSVLESYLSENNCNPFDLRFFVKKGIGTEKRNIKKEKNNGRTERPASNPAGTASGML